VLDGQAEIAVIAVSGRAVLAPHRQEQGIADALRQLEKLFGEFERVGHAACDKVIPHRAGEHGEAMRSLTEQSDELVGASIHPFELGGRPAFGGYQSWHERNQQLQLLLEPLGGR
jgi:hypothetical protein